MLIDTHAHLNFNAYKTDSAEVIKRTLENDVWVINIGTQYDTSKKAVEIAEKYGRGVYAAIGFHPIHLNTGLVKMKLDQEEIAFNSRADSNPPSVRGAQTKVWEGGGRVGVPAEGWAPEFNYEKYKELAKNEKVVAIGEIGLDYYYKPKTKRKLELFQEKQREALIQQLNLANELNLSVIFHCRMAHPDLIEILSENSEIRPQKAVAHGFVGNLEELQKYLNFGFYIGFNGIIFKSIEGINFEENIRKTPLDKILVETDCPYLTPPPFKNQRNEPLYVKYVAEKIAKIKNLSFEEISEITTDNTKKLFNL